MNPSTPSAAPPPPLQRVRRPLVVRLIAITFFIVLAVASTITVVATVFFTEDTRARAEDQNLTTNELVALRAEGEVRNLHRSALALLDSSDNGADPGSAQVLRFFSRNSSVLYVGLQGRQGATNLPLWAACEGDPRSLETFFQANAGRLERGRGGETLFLNASPWLGFPSGALVVPYRDLGHSDALVILFTMEVFQGMVTGNGAGRTLVVSGEGVTLAHSETELTAAAAHLSADPAVDIALKNSGDNLQFRFTDKGVGFIGAFHKVGLGRFIVLSTIPTADLYSAAFAVARQNLYITGVVLLLAILAVWFFARSVTRPVLALVDAARAIEGGRFDGQFSARSQDELGLLTQSFAAMSRGLAERERIKETFGKFVNREIAEQALTGQLALGGVRKTATIFFSDIRSFTAISEQLPPEAVVEFLNDYMTRMVDCIEKTHGVVDKFIGDAIMAVWGAPVSRGSPKADALECVNAALMMRAALGEFNQGRGAPGRPVLRIGCGINTGPCLAGQIGSAHRMEYTVIGDSVNLASRIEALNKPFGTDILISQNTYDLVADAVEVELMPPIRVKGKSAALRIYAVINRRGAPGPRTLAEVRAWVGLNSPDGVAGDEETKYEILSR